MVKVNNKAIIAAKLYLEMRNFKIIENNYRRAGSLIDVIAQKNNAIYFVTINYSASEDNELQQSNIIPSDYMRKIKVGAQNWLEETKCLLDYHFSLIEVVGKNYTVFGYIDDIF